MKRYEPLFTTTERAGQLALWVTMPDGSTHNIWDMPHAEHTHDVAEAIQWAFRVGMQAKSMMVQKVL